MSRFYIDENTIMNNSIHITGGDVNHMKNVLRMKEGEYIILCNGKGRDYHCRIHEMYDNKIIADIIKEEKAETELSVKIYLFQGLPKKDKMELIIQKAVELGVYEIIPVLTKRTVVKLEDKKKELKKLERWQLIAEGAAKQSGRGIVPKVAEAVTFLQALPIAEKLEIVMIPYELAKDMDKTRDIMKSVKGKKTAGIFIGPEGGFEENEIEKAISKGIWPITLGKRILRTETAGIAALSILTYELE